MQAVWRFRQALQLAKGVAHLLMADAVRQGAENLEGCGSLYTDIRAASPEMQVVALDIQAAGVLRMEDETVGSAPPVAAL